MTMTTESQKTPDQMSFGERAVDAMFASNNAVADIKAQFASLIDHMKTVESSSTNPEARSTAATAIVQIQTAQMWTVKAMTFNT